MPSKMQIYLHISKIFRTFARRSHLRMVVTATEFKIEKHCGYTKQLYPSKCGLKNIDLDKKRAKLLKQKRIGRRN